ncbi:MAG: helix-turn-helix domain-containing protein, partial [Mycobacterium sp.]
YQRGVQRLVQVAPDPSAELRFVGNQLRDTLSMLAAAARWDRDRLGFTDPPWTMVGIYTLGRLLAPPD